MYESDKVSNEQKLSQLMDGEWHELNRSECVATLCADEVLRSKWARYHIIRDTLKNEPVQADQALALRICSAIDDEPAYSNVTHFGGSGDAASVATDMSQSAIMPASQDQTAGSQGSETGATNSVQSGEESGSQQSESTRKSSWFNTGVAGFALAASVALVTVVGVNMFEQQGTTPGVPAVASNVETPQNADLPAIAGIADAPRATMAGADTVLPVVDFVANTGSYWASPESSARVSDEQRLNMMLSRHIENSPTASREGLLPYSRLVSYEEIGQGR